MEDDRHFWSTSLTTPEQKSRTMMILALALQQCFTRQGSKIVPQ